MPRLDVYPIPGPGPRPAPGSRSRAGYVVDVQAELLSHLATRTVVPLLPEAAAPRPISELNPVFDVLGTPHVLVTQAIATVPRSELRGAVASLAGQHDGITRALDVLLLGF